MTLEQVYDLERSVRTQFRGDGKISVFCLVVNKPVKGESNSYGIAYNNTSFYLATVPMQETADDYPVDYPSVELSILKHEFTHLLNLVKSPGSGPLQDGVHGAGEHEGTGADGKGTGHCKIESCLMYVSPNVETFGPQSDLANRIQRYGVLNLDALCLADLRATGENRRI